MKMIKMKSLLSLALALCACLSLWGQAVTVNLSGRVLIGSELQPAANYPVWINTENGGRQTIHSSEDGSFNTAIDLALDANGFAKVSVETFDFCSAQTLARSFIIIPDSTTFYNITFRICAGARPPANGGCGAFFTSTQDSDDPLTVKFQDLSYSTSPITSWKWDFGDGNVSNQQNPNHTYAQGGIYTVQLNIIAETDITSETPDSTCSSAFRYTIFIGDYNNCNCTKEYIPVCIATPSGGFLTFPNRCYALCEGYSEDIFVPCQDSTCVCPAVYDPVCVVVNGDTITFGNACEAACRGFGEGDFVECRNDGGCVCPEYYDPVCVVVNGDTLTYSNICFATCAGFDSTDIIQCQPNACLCPPVYDPVCVMLADGNIRPFDNKCFALCNGFKESDIVPCDTSGCACPLIYDPVCVANNGDTLTYSNRCFAICAGVDPADIVQCQPNACICPPVYDPVCIKLDDGIIIQYNSRCEALCNGFNENDFVRCDSTNCECPTDEYDPVCVILPDGSIKEFVSPCYALCAGYTPDDFIECDSNACNCPLTVYEPVCAISPNGDTLTFDNRCFARCAGYSEDQLFFCNYTGDCLCPFIYDPVCVLNGDTLLITFPNACVAECYGFSPEDFVDCDSSNCVCPEYYDPVCVISANGDTLTFDNPCFAACSGYYAGDFIRCNNDPVRNCYADFYARQEDSTSLEISFYDKSYADNQIISWQWDFGDGIIEEGGAADNGSINHIYERPGLYKVVLTIITRDGCSSTTVRHVYVYDSGVVNSPNCQAVFLFRQEPTDNNTLYFRDFSIGNIVSWKWDFGDGNTSNAQNPTHTYASTGVFFVKLTVRTADCTSTTSMIVFVDPNAIYENECNALFLPLLYVDSMQVFFRNLSSPDAVAFLWNFGDGSTSTERDPFHTYGSADTYEVSLTATTANGCMNTFRVILNLGSQDFTSNPAYLVLTDTDQAITFSDLKLYPNPAKDQLNLEFNLPQSGDYQLNIFSLEGKLLQSRNESAASGKNITQVQIGDLPTGVYFLRIQSNEHIKTLKFVKQ
ncbi:MAG: PKD domain-containing protein [Saprospiraceae bacterium]|nr:PKD domain-containing protein [Saprospiraceae bacterium]